MFRFRAALRQFQRGPAVRRNFSYTSNILKSKTSPIIEQLGKQSSVDKAEDDDEYFIDVSNIEKRWLSLSFETQQDIISYLNVKQEFDWTYLTNDEKKAIHYIAYGKWGPRDESVMTSAEFVFKLMTNMLLFTVLGFSIMNYYVDQEKIAQMTASAEDSEATA